MTFSDWLMAPMWWVWVVVSFVAGLVLTDGAIHVARRFGLFAALDARSAHTASTPQVGGIGIAVPVLAWLFYLVVAARHPDKSLHLFFYLFFGSGLLFFAIGLWDDLGGIPAKKKLFAQVVAGAMATEVLAAVMVVLAGTHASALLAGQIVTAIIWLVWVVGFVNVFNFMDGMNGKAGLFALNALVFGLVMMTVHVEDGSREAWFTQLTRIPADALVEPMGIAVGAVGGFMVLNCRPVTRVFLGDCGSHFLGCFLATVAFAVSTSLVGPGLSLLSFAVLFMPFVFDAVYTLAHRSVAGKSIWEAHRGHLYQRLLGCGIGHMRVLGICAITYVVCGMLAVVCVRVEGIGGRLGCLAAAVGTMVVYGMYVPRVEGKRRRGDRGI